MRITEQDIFDAADKLFAQGITPNGAKIRLEIGRGSNSDIYPHLKTWRKLENNRGCVESTEPIPNDIKEPAFKLFRNLIERLWTEALEEAQKRYKDEWLTVLQDENKQLKEDIMHYKEMKIELKTIKDYQNKFEKSVENRIKELEKDKKQTPPLINFETDLITEGVQNK